MGKRKRIFSGETNPFELKDSRKSIFEAQTCSETSLQNAKWEFFKNKRQKIEMEVELYKNTLKAVNEKWKSIKQFCLKNKSDTESSSKDSYDISRCELLFDKKSVVSSTKDIQPLKVLNNIKDFNLETLVKNVSNKEFMNDIIQDLHYLAGKNRLETAHILREVLDIEYDIFSYFKKQNTKKNFLRFQTVIFLNFMIKVYSNTEVRHPIITPAMIFMADILSTNFNISYDNIFKRLFICATVFDCASQCKKFVPEAVQFLLSVLQLTVPKGGKEDATFGKCFNLIVNVDISSEEIPELQLYAKNEKLPLVNKKIGVIFMTASLTLCFATLYKDYPLSKLAFQPFREICMQLPLHLYPVEMGTLIKRLVEFLGRETPPLHHLAQSIKPKLLQMFEPVFDCKFESIENYERELHNPNIKDTKNRAKLNEQQKRLKSVAKKIRKEQRSVLKEIRKSSKAAASVKLEEKQALDVERQKKTAKIYSQLAIQEYEFKKMLKRK